MDGKGFSEGLFAAMAMHCERLGEPGWVDHEVALVQWPAIHACTHKPTPDRPWVTLRTEGMSDEPLDAPPDSTLDRVELLLYWPGSSDDDVPPWMTEVLRATGHVPHDFNSHFDLFDVVQLTDAEDPFPGTNLVGAFIRRPTLEPDGWATMPHRDGAVTFLEVVLVTMDEIEFWGRNGGEALNSRLVAAGVTAVVDPQRSGVGGATSSS